MTRPSAPGEASSAAHSRLHSRPDRDVVVIGGGPAGSTVAALLARQGRSVVLVEKERHPRFHIGESLLPANVELLERLGVRGQVEAIGMAKWGIEFCSPQHGHRCHLEFADAWDKSMPMAWQVRRSDFDRILFDHAAACGAETWQGCRVRHVAFDADGADVEAVGSDGAAQRWRSRLVVDASGRDTLLAAQLGHKRRNPRHASAAIFGHFRGARRLDGRREGDITIVWFAHGWFWFIPLADGSTSVGAVCAPRYLKTRAGQPLADFFADTIALAPDLAERLQGAVLEDGKVWATGNYSYDSACGSGERWLLVGDAYAFVDPVFSSGVYLAMTSAFACADTAAVCLDRPARGAAARRRYDRLLRHGPRAFSWFIQRMTNPALRHLFMHPSSPLRMQEAVLALLSGDIYGRSPIRASLLAFKAVYLALSIASLPRSVAAWRLRRRHARDGRAPLAGENVMQGAS